MQTPHCKECLRRCEHHGVTHCAICHKHEGECEYGGCSEPYTHLVEHPRETRRFCVRHAIDAAFGFARVGAEVTHA